MISYIHKKSALKCTVALSDSRSLGQKPSRRGRLPEAKAFRRRFLGPDAAPCEASPRGKANTLDEERALYMILYHIISYYIILSYVILHYTIMCYNILYYILVYSYI